MKTRYHITLILLIIGGLYGKELVFGEPLSQTEVTPVSTILAAPDDYVGKIVKVRGPVVDVCANRGCWMDIGGDEPFQKITIKVEDGEMIFPLTAKGHTAIAEGKVEKLHWTRDEVLEIKKHQAEEQGIEFDPNDPSIKERTIYRIRGIGAVIEE
ncbi:MAG: DUF4920 domain-containing protein [Fidelibacterota bacterium]